MAERTALLLGATGLVGSHCLQLLLQAKLYREVTILTRRPVTVQHPGLRQHVLDFDNLAAHKNEITGDDVFCALGTTLAKAGSKAAFRRVDYGYPLAAAQAAVRNGAKRLALVSSHGAGKKSAIFYLRVKTELEEAVAALPFESVAILRPSLLLGRRREARRHEQLSGAILRRLSFLLAGPLRNVRPIEARAVAAVMVQVLKTPRPGIHLYPSLEIQKIYDHQCKSE